MHEVVDDKNVLNLFTVGSHYRNISVIFLTQNVYEKGKYARSISLNSHYFILFKNRRDQAQITHLARQIFSGIFLFFTSASAEVLIFRVISLARSLTPVTQKRK